MDKPREIKRPGRKWEEHADKGKKRRRRIYADVVFNYFETNQLGAIGLCFCTWLCSKILGRYRPLFTYTAFEKEN